MSRYEAVAEASRIAESRMGLFLEALNERVAEREARDEVDHLARLVARFADALLEKLRAAEAKYGYQNDWMREGWQDELPQHLADHVAKGDPRDVAAYCAFAWHHGWSIAPPTRQDGDQAETEGGER